MELREDLMQDKTFEEIKEYCEKSESTCVLEQLDSYFSNKSDTSRKVREVKVKYQVYFWFKQINILKEYSFIYSRSIKIKHIFNNLISIIRIS